MSLLSNPPHFVLVKNREVVRDGRGNRVYQDVGEPIGVRCAVQSVREWATAEEMLEGGMQLLSLRRLFSATWPGDVNSLVAFEGHVYETVGDPQHFNMRSRRTRHWLTTIRQIGKVKEDEWLRSTAPSE